MSIVTLRCSFEVNVRVPSATSIDRPYRNVEGRFGLLSRTEGRRPRGHATAKRKYDHFAVDETRFGNGESRGEGVSFGTEFRGIEKMMVVGGEKSARASDNKRKNH